MRPSPVSPSHSPVTAELSVSAGCAVTYSGATYGDTFQLQDMCDSTAKGVGHVQ